ncbi:flagellar assembly protein FliH [Cytobacillus purgationiresistens]|uniref:Flagellar assembly protein FliH n=1 Tax=Cytobacillus purgationiresistens TaxID=863449 RepID=A0ABU0AJH6_9BACI|nr:flagellar assembly protein FliH [Cytobacillus purgationiresistens]MDQ0270230.1 flagellar assembly protein FliH [Cytobacillus purgationiresistens]
MSRLYKVQQPLSHEQAKMKVISVKQLSDSSGSLDKETPIPNLKQMEKMIKDAEAKADQIIITARQEADKLREALVAERQALQIEREQVLEQAIQEGHQSGLESGRTTGYEEYIAIINEAKGIVHSAKVDHDDHIQSAEQTILLLGMKVAEKITGNVIHQQDNHFLSYVKRSLKEARQYRDIQLHVHPERYEYILSFKDELLSLFPNEISLYVFPNEEITKDNCLIESDNGRIDASVKSQIEEIKLKLLEVLETGGHESRAAFGRN